jgi:hypothetical protein
MRPSFVASRDLRVSWKPYEAVICCFPRYEASWKPYWIETYVSYCTILPVSLTKKTMEDNRAFRKKGICNIKAFIRKTKLSIQYRVIRVEDLMWKFTRMLEGGYL